MVIQVVLGITVFLAAGAVLGGPLAAALTSSTTTANSATTSKSIHFPHNHVEFMDRLIFFFQVFQQFRPLSVLLPLQPRLSRLL